ncbi:MAG: TIGR00730 family Rossman fold protein [Gammaproteobacteria bacterium]
MNIVDVGIEMAEAQQRLAPYKNNITVFGSARVNRTDPLYQDAYQLAKELSDDGYNILTGAGPGIMKAANKGAYEGKSKSIGLNIELPHEQSANPYLDECLTFEHFFSRKVMLVKHARACVYFPGGYGTADELMEVLTLVQTQKMRPIPLILYGIDYWKPLLSWFEQLAEDGYIDHQDLMLMHVVDSIDEIIQIIKESVCH